MPLKTMFFRFFVFYHFNKNSGFDFDIKAAVMCLSQTHTLQIFALIPGDILLSIFFQLLYHMKQLFIAKAECISMHIHIGF